MRGVHSESKKEVYDVVVIGAGIGGLSVAALLAKAGKSVLLVERHDRPGGYAHGFKRRGFHFDSGVHLVSGCGFEGYLNGSTIHKICLAVGIDPQVIFIPIPAYARAVYPEFEISLQAGEEAFIAGLTERFPEEKDRLLDLIRLCRVLAEEAMVADEILEQGRAATISPALALANLFRYRRATLAEALDEFLVDPRLKSACASLWPYLGLAALEAILSVLGQHDSGLYLRRRLLLSRQFSDLCQSSGCCRERARRRGVTEFQCAAHLRGTRQSVRHHIGERSSYPGQDGGFQYRRPPDCRFVNWTGTLAGRLL